MFNWLRRRRLSAAAQKKLMILHARAEEAVITTHVSNLLELLETLEDEVDVAERRRRVGPEVGHGPPDPVGRTGRAVGGGHQSLPLATMPDCSAAASASISPPCGTLNW